LRAATLHSAGILEQRLGELADLVGEGGREKQVLPDRRQQRDDALDVRHEAHVEHAVGFVQDQHRHLVEHQRLVLHVVEQAAGRGDEDLDALAQRADLRVHVRRRRRRWRCAAAVLAVVAEALLTWTASSRVGVSTSTRIGWRAGEAGGAGMRRQALQRGSANAAVLPVPVWAPP
jgi:hypothetical protein